MLHFSTRWTMTHSYVESNKYLRKIQLQPRNQIPQAGNGLQFIAMVIPESQQKSQTIKVGNHSY